MFPEVKKETSKYNSGNRNERYRYQCPIIMRYLENKLCGWCIGDFFEAIGAERVALYAVTEFTEYVLRDLLISGSASDVVCIGDRNYLAYRQGFFGKEVVSPDEIVKWYQEGQIDKIIICTVFHSNAVFDDFLKRNVRQEDLISVTSAIFSFDISK